MEVRRLGESLVILQDVSMRADALARAIEECAKVERWPGFIEAVAAFDQVGVYMEPEFDLARLDREFVAVGPRDLAREYVIPVLYDGEDLEEVAKLSGLTVAQVIEGHQSGRFSVEAVGFCPGFPYLGGLPEVLHGLPRRDSPRARVPAGSVAIVGDKGGIYPLVRPGGWWLIGRTPLVLVDGESEFFPLQAGDSVRFVEIDSETFASREGQRLCAEST